ncbi:hypothetical protein [Roseovarius sp. D0-M9]|uniref:hypothetical protein n=1 Tax=Roseovarius sp. D0-M9 TaxID=3127117 RepID=UPI00300FFDFC
MHDQSVVRCQFRRHLVDCQTGLRRDPGLHPIRDICQLAAPGITLPLRCKRPGLAPEPNHIVDELDRNTQPTRRLSVRVALPEYPTDAAGSPLSADCFAIACRAMVALVLPVRAALAMPRAADSGHLNVYQPLRGVLDQFPQEIRVIALGDHARKVDHGLGHRALLRCHRSLNNLRLRRSAVAARPGRALRYAKRLRTRPLTPLSPDNS